MTEDEWRAALRAARAAWPSIDVPDSAFAAHAEERRGQGGALAEHLGDLYLAFAAALGNAAAHRALDEHIFSSIDGAVRAIDSRPSFTDEVRQALRVKLLVAADGAPPRIAEYRGSGPLSAWVKVAAMRAALSFKRSDRPAMAIEDVLSDLAASEPDPELRHLKGLYRSQYAEALRESLLALEARQRALLRMHYVDGLRLAQIAGLYKVHESTASRWVTAAVEAVARGARKRLSERLALSPDALGSVERLVQSNLEISLARLLSLDKAAENPAI